MSLRTHFFFNKILDFLLPILFAVTVDSSNHILASQIHGISVILFVLSLMIVILIVGLLFNVFILIYSDKFKELFVNKFIRAYINLNKKFIGIGIEIFFLERSILYFMFYLTYGLQFLATHRIMF